MESKLDGSNTVTADAVAFTLALVPAFPLMNVMMSAAVLPPLYASPSLLPAGKYFRVGKPVTPKRPPRSRCASASTDATLTGSDLKAVATTSYSGARALQWPHQGAKNSTNTGWSPPT